MNNMAFELIYIIVDENKGSKVLNHAKKLGSNGGTILKAKGTIKDKFLDFLTLNEVDKELVLIVERENTVNDVVNGLVSKFNFEKKNTGIIFTISLDSFIASKDNKFNRSNQIEREESMYKLITTIVEKGKAQDVVEFSNEAGARGATILNARGSGTSETLKLFNMQIEPEKEVVLILVSSDKLDDIVENISNKLEIEKPNKGILFVQDIKQAYGLYENK